MTEQVSSSEIAQGMIDEPWREEAAFSVAREALESHNRIPTLHDQLKASPEDPKLRLDYATADAKVKGVFGRAAITCARVIGTPAIAEEHLIWWQKNKGVIYDPKDKDPLSPDCYENYVEVIPDPFARFIVGHADCSQVALVTYEDSILKDPTHKYHALLPILHALKRQATDAHNHKITLKQQADRPRKGNRDSILPHSPSALRGPRAGLIENAYLMMLSFIAADVACADKGITDEDEVMRVLLRNASLFLDIVETTAECFPYYLPSRDKNEFKIPYARSFRRLVEVCVMGEGRMVLDADGKLRLPVADISRKGVCPLAAKVEPPQESLDQMDHYNQMLSRVWGVSLDQLRKNTALGFASSFFFHYSLILARDTFLGKSKALTANPHMPKLPFIGPL